MFSFFVKIVMLIIKKRLNFVCQISYPPVNGASQGTDQIKISKEPFRDTMVEGKILYMVKVAY